MASAFALSRPGCTHGPDGVGISPIRTEGRACLDVGNGTLWPAGRLDAALRPHGTRRVTRADTPTKKSPPSPRIAAAVLAKKHGQLLGPQPARGAAKA